VWEWACCGVRTSLCFPALWALRCIMCLILHSFKLHYFRNVFRQQEWSNQLASVYLAVLLLVIYTVKCVLLFCEVRKWTLWNVFLLKSIILSIVLDPHLVGSSWRVFVLPHESYPVMMLILAIDYNIITSLLLIGSFLFCLTRSIKAIIFEKPFLVSLLCIRWWNWQW